MKSCECGGLKEGLMFMNQLMNSKYILWKCLGKLCMVLFTIDMFKDSSLCFYHSCSHVSSCTSCLCKLVYVEMFRMTIGHDNYNLLPFCYWHFHVVLQINNIQVGLMFNLFYIDECHDLKVLVVGLFGFLCFDFQNL